jgi:hypothetical protein
MTLQQALLETVGQRLSYIAQCFSALGFGIAESRNRAFALYTAQITEALLHNQGTPTQRTERMAFMLRLVLTPSEKQ